MDDEIRERLERLEMLAATELRREATPGLAGLVRAYADSGWLDVGSYGTNYSRYDPAAFPPQYRKLPNGMVIFRGLIKKSVAVVAAETMFTVPAGYRPGTPYGTLTALACAAGYFEARAYSTGIVNVGGYALPAGANSYIALDSLSYLAEN